MTTAVSFQNVSYAYEGDTQAANNISFQVNDGECVAIIGKNGAGKSTLLSLMTGVFFAKSGSVHIYETEVNKKTLQDIRKQVGYVFQNPDEQLFMASILDDLKFGPMNYGVSEESAQEIALKTAKSLGIEHLLDRMPSRLSGGEKRLCAIAGVLCCKPRVVLLDEPLSFLDPAARENVITNINNIQATKIIATHDLDMAYEICDRVIIIKGGQIISDGGKELLENEELLRDGGLRLPLSLQRCKSCEKN